MRIVFVAVLLLGLGLAGLAALMVREQFDALAQGRPDTSAVPMTSVVVARRDIRYGEKLTKDDLTFADLPSNLLPEGTIHSVEEMFPKGPAAPRSALRSMLAKEPVLLSKVTEPGEDAGVATRLATGRRAFAISVDVASGVSGFLRPDDRVDIFWTGELPGLDTRATRLIDTHVRIVAIDQSADGERTGATVARTVTVEATPRQVAALAQAQASGRLSLALVGALDERISDHVEIDQRDLLGMEQERVAAPVSAPERCSIRTRRGSEVVEIPIPCTN